MTPLENEILDRWAIGQSGGDIRAALNLSRNRVTDVVCAARARGDRRAIIHAWSDGMPIGRFAHRAPAWVMRA